MALISVLKTKRAAMFLILIFVDGSSSPDTSKGSVVRNCLSSVSSWDQIVRSCFQCEVENTVNDSCRLERLTVKNITKPKLEIHLKPKNFAVKNELKPDLSIKLEIEQFTKLNITKPEIDMHLKSENISGQNVSKPELEMTFKPENSTVKNLKKPELYMNIKSENVVVNNSTKLELDMNPRSVNSTVQNFSKPDLDMNLKSENLTETNLTKPKLEINLKSDTFNIQMEVVSISNETLEPIKTEPQRVAQDISPFSQWTEKRLEEEKKRKEDTKRSTNGKLSHIQISKNGNSEESKDLTVENFTNDEKLLNGNLLKNFASPDCSAKVLDANPESHGWGNLITKAKDEYFINKCSASAWFVVELCESLKIFKIQLANYELYSSSPNKFTVYMANQYPLDKGTDWVKFGTFYYENERSVQTFKGERGIVGRYVRVKILSHHDNEHFCPISRFKVYGIPEIDLLSEDDHDTSNKESSDDEPNTNIQETAQHSEKESIKLRKNEDVRETNRENNMSININMDGNKSGINDVEFIMIHRYPEVLRYLKLNLLRRSLTSFCISFPDKVSTTQFKSPWKFIHFLRLYLGDNFLAALCEAHLILTNTTKTLKGTIHNVSTVKQQQNNQENLIFFNDESAKVSKITRIIPLQEKNIDLDVKDTKVNDKDQSNNENQSVAINPINETFVKPTMIQNNDSDEITENVNGSTEEEFNINTDKFVIQTSSQTTWQKLSTRIKGLERNVSLSTDFLEELSMKYIKSMEELTKAAKLTNSAVSDLVSDFQTFKINVTSRLDNLEERFNKVENEIERGNWLGLWKCPRCIQIEKTPTIPLKMSNLEERVNKVENEVEKGNWLGLWKCPRCIQLDKTPTIPLKMSKQSSTHNISTLAFILCLIATFYTK